MLETDLNENCYNRRTPRSQPRFKLWHSVGLMLTYWCSSRCACCYVYCGPDADVQSEPMSTELAISCWRSILRLAGTRGKVHITGGEPFKHYARIKDILHRAGELALSGLEKVETNAYWCMDELTARERLTELDRLGLTLLQISTDIYHQEYIPIERVQLCYRIACEILGHDRVRLRWHEFYENPVLLKDLEPDIREELLRDELTKRPERMVGRAGDCLARLARADDEIPAIKLISYQDLTDFSCTAILGAGHVHIDAAGRVFSGTCAGIILCTVDSTDDNNLFEQWKRFDPERHPIWSVLLHEGPAGLARIASEYGFEPETQYAGKCHLCFEVRKYLYNKGLFLEWLGPALCYGSKAES